MNCYHDKKEIKLYS